MDLDRADLFGFTRFSSESGGHKGTRDCEAYRCKKTTREGKPFCSIHIEHSPYIQVILAKLHERGIEEEILERGCGEVPAEGFFVRESLLLLRTKDFTIKSFSRRLDISHRAAERLILLLGLWGHAEVVKTSRGGRTVRGTGPRDLIDGI